MTTHSWQLDAPWLQRTEGNASQALGSAIWLWMHDVRHRKEALQDMEHRLLAPIEAGQYVIVRKSAVAVHNDSDCHPQALLLFARFDERAEARYLSDPSQRIAIRDWHSGDRLWLIDWAAPFGDTVKLRQPLMALLAGRTARSLCRPGTGAAAQVRLWRGPTGKTTAAGDRAAARSPRKNPSTGESGRVE